MGLRAQVTVQKIQECPHGQGVDSLGEEGISMQTQYVSHFLPTWEQNDSSPREGPYNNPMMRETGSPLSIDQEPQLSG